MNEIQIPFREDMARAIIEGRKYCTSRNKSYGLPGEFFWVEADGRKQLCEFLGKVQLPLRFVAIALSDLEGFDTSHDFINAWKEMHPRLGWTPDKLVWVHWFERVGEGLKCR